MNVSKPEKSVFKMTFELNVPFSLDEEWAYSHILKPIENTIFSEMEALSDILNIKFEEMEDDE